MTTSTSGADHASVRRVARLLMALSGREVDGASNAALAKALGCTESACLRTLQTLADEGLVEQIAASKRWRLGPRLVQVAVDFAAGLDRAQHKLDETRQRYTRLPH